MPSNAEAAELLRSIADILDLKGERFKPEAYRRAARSVDGLGEDLAAVAGRAELDAIPGVGAAIAEKLREYLREGHIAYLDRLLGEVPAGIVALLKVPGLGPKTVRRFWVELGVQGPAELAAAIDAGRLTGVGGFGPTKIRQIRTALDAKPPAARLPLLEATLLAASLRAAISSGAPVERLEVAGSLRRARETVGDLDLLVISADANAVFDVVARLPNVGRVVLRGGTKETVLLDTGVQVDVRVLPPPSFGAALQYFTGSKDHNVRLRSLARDRGLKINEYGVYRGEEALPAATEADVYRALGLPEIPPELREDRGEIDAAVAGKLPRLVEAGDVRGDLHVHLPEGAGPDALAEVHRSAAALGHAYVGVVLGGEAGSSDVRRYRDAVAARSGGPTFYLGIEVPATSWAAPRPEGIDYRILAADTGRPPSEGSADPRTLGVGHLPTAPNGGTEGDPAVAAPWIRFAAEVGTGVELPATGAREGLDSASARIAVAKGARVLLSGRSIGSVDPRRLGVAVALARRAGLGPREVRNCDAEPWTGATGPRTTPPRPPRRKAPSR